MELVLPLSTPFPSPSLALIDLNEDAAIARRELLKKWRSTSVAKINDCIFCYEPTCLQIILHFLQAR